MDKTTRAWLETDAKRFPSVARSLHILDNTLALIQATCVAAGIPRSALRAPDDPRPGRKTTFPWAEFDTHRREKHPGEVLDSINHRREHKTTHVIQCQLCISRRWNYLNRHPELQRPQEWWETEHPIHATVDGLPRQYVDPGWMTENPEPDPNSYDEILKRNRDKYARKYGIVDQVIEKGSRAIRREPGIKTLIRGVWPQTDDVEE